MANTYVDYTATAAQQYFAFNFPYLEDEHVVVEIEGVDQTITTNYTIETSPSQRINLSNPTTALAGGELVRIKRRSAPNTNLVDFQNGSVLTESELDRAYLHNRYLAEEATEGADSGLKELEGSTNYNAGNKQIKNLADGTLATDAVNKGYVDTQIALTDTNLTGFYKSTHTGNAVDNVFTLSFTPQTTDAKAYIVSIDGLVQVPDTDYTIGATAITFNTIPANSAEICVVATAAASVATINESQVTATGSSQARSLADRFADVVNVLDYGAKGDGVTDDTNAIQNAVNNTPFGGSVFFPHGTYKISSAITVNKPMTLYGTNAGSIYNENGSYIKQITTTENAFTLVARTENYAFSQYGVVGVTFDNLQIIGNSSGSRSVTAIGVDTSVNSGDFHIRECVFRDVNIKWFQKAYDLEGIAYLNDWFNGAVRDCDKGVVITRGGGSDIGGQSRFFGLTATGNNGACVELNLDTNSGDFAFFGCTLSESVYGIKCEEEALLGVYGCQFESNTSAGIYIEIAEANPNTEAPKAIHNCKFINNGNDIHIDKTTTAFVGGGFHFPLSIDSCVLQSTNAIHITVPAGHTGIDSPAFVIGASNSGSVSSKLGDSQISSLFLGTDLRDYPFNGFKNSDLLNNSQQISHQGLGVTNVIIGAMLVPAGYTLNVKNTSVYSYDSTTGARGDADFKIIDASSTVLLDLFGNSDGAEGTWTNTTGSSVNVRFRVNDGASSNPFVVTSRISVTI